MAVHTGEPQVAPVLDETKLNEFIGRAVADWGALGSAALVRIGDRLGLYDAIAEAGSVTSTELAVRTGTAHRAATISPCSDRVW